MDIRDPVNLGIIIAMFAVPFALGWAWWAYSAPRWRLWAMECVEDWDELSALALKSMLIWPDQPLTRLAAKSEFVTAEILRKKLELEQKRGRTFPGVAG
jgi:hypothetical protein